MGRTGMFSLVAVVAFLVAGVLAAGQLVENVDAREIMVLQDPIDGELHVFITAGLKPQLFGKVTKYPRRQEYAFNDENNTDKAKRLRFNDGGHAKLSGAVSWEMPLDETSIIEIHKKFGSTEAIQAQAVAKMINAAVYLAGPLMSSTESSGERRSELVQVINDQAENGVYRTIAKEITVKDPLSGQEKTKLVTTILHGTDGQPLRQQSSILTEFKIRLLPLSISELKYDAVVEDQIKQRQVANTAVQISQANARKAEQDVITVEAQGQAKAATAKWEQEVIKATKVTEAEQKLRVAELDAKEAEQYKIAEILRGEGEAARKRLVMEADGALNPKLEAYKEVNQMYATAIATYQGAWVPAIVMGGSNGAGQVASGANTLVDLLTVKTAKDLGLDLSLSGRDRTVQRPKK